MKTTICASCGSRMKKNGKTKAGAQRWRCTECGSSYSHKINSDAKALEAFVKWLLSKERQRDMAGEGRSFRRLAKRFWGIWPLPDPVDEVHPVIYVDGIYIARDVVILIACSDDYVLSWYLARSENSRAWEALLSRIAPPDMVVTDGGPGFAKACKNVWPNTLMQRCLFHVFCQVRRCTTSRPKLQAGKEIYQHAKRLMHVKDLKEAEEWVEGFMHWCEFWCDFLSEFTYKDGAREYTHERLRKARRALVGLINKGTLFNYLNPSIAKGGPFPCMNNRIEGGVNAQLRSILRNHRGLSTLRRIKAVYWWCYMHTECPKPYAEILKSMPTDADIDYLYETYGIGLGESEGPAEWGEGLVWDELHAPTKYPYSVD